MLTIEHPDSCAPETAYILSVVFDDFLGIPYQTKPSGGGRFRLAVGDASLTLPSLFLPALARGEAPALAARPPASWDSRTTGWTIPLVDPVVPVMFGDASFEQGKNHIDLGIDVFGAAFFMLSRYEETLPDQRDVHDRFSVVNAKAYRHGFLLRPIIDEYVEVLWAAMQQLWPGLQRKERQFAIVPTHDVDIPYLGLNLRSTRQLLQRCAGDLLKRRSPGLMAQTLRSHRRIWAESGQNGADRFAGDPYNVFDWLMKTSEQAGVRSRFYFMTDHEPHHPLGGNYDIATPHIQTLMQRISERGHEIGIHPTGESYHDRAVMLHQAERLRGALAACGIEQSQKGGRHHYLRWRADTTPRFWHDAGLDYDSTLGHAEHVGFRCGTCHPFPIWDLIAREKLDVEERPLIVMERSLLDHPYMGLDPVEAAAIVRQVRDAVEIVKGNFLILWHNSSLTLPWERDFYSTCLDL